MERNINYRRSKGVVSQGYMTATRRYPSYLQHNRTYVYQEKEIHNHFNDILVIPQRAVRDILGPILVYCSQPEFYDKKERKI